MNQISIIRGIYWSRYKSINLFWQSQCTLGGETAVKRFSLYSSLYLCSAFLSWKAFNFGLIPLEKYFFYSPCPLLQNKKSKRRRLPGESIFLTNKYFSSFRTKHLLLRILSSVLLTHECSAKYEPLKWIGGLQLGLAQCFPWAIWHWNLKTTGDF